MSDLTRKQEWLIDAMVDGEALKFGEFTLKSGRISPYFVNLGGMTTGSDLIALAEAYGDLIMEKFEDVDVDVLFGPAYKGIPLAAVVAYYLADEYDVDVRYCANRKEAKGHGEGGNLLGGPINKGDKVLIIEDVTTSGESIEEVMPILKGYEATVVGEVIALDREERGQETENFALKEIEAKYGFPVYPVLKVSDVLAYLYDDLESKEDSVISEETRQKITEYYDQYGGKPAEE